MTFCVILLYYMYYTTICMSILVVAIKKLFKKKLLSSIVKRELWDITLSWFVAISIFYIVCFEAVARGRFNVRAS